MHSLEEALIVLEEIRAEKKTLDKAILVRSTEVSVGWAGGAVGMWRGVGPGGPRKTALKPG